MFYAVIFVVAKHEKETDASSIWQPPNGLVQYCNISGALTMEVMQFRT